MGMLMETSSWHRFGFLIVLLTCLTAANSASGQLMDKDTKGPVLQVDPHRHVLAACAKAFVFMKSFPRDAEKMKLYCSSVFWNG